MRQANSGGGLRGLRLVLRQNLDLDVGIVGFMQYFWAKSRGGPSLPRTIMSSRTCSGITVPVPEPHALSGACLGTKGSLPQSRILILQRFD